MNAAELLDALDKIKDDPSVDPEVIWVLREYLKAAWKKDPLAAIRPFNLGTALSAFFVDLSQHRLPERLRQDTPETEELLLQTFGAPSPSHFQFWMKCAEIWQLALRPFPSFASDMHDYFDLLMKSSAQPGPGSAPQILASPPSIASSPAVISGSDNESGPDPSAPIKDIIFGPDSPFLPPIPGTTSEAINIPKTAFLVHQGTRVIPLNQPLIKLGRRLDNSIILEDPRVSRTHAQLKWINDHFVIFDLDSTGGTYINGMRTNQSVLYPGDVISLAGVKFVFSQELPARPAEVTIIELGSAFAVDHPTGVLHKEQLKPRMETGNQGLPELPKTAPLRK